jgi:hypothetical protein
MTKTLRVCLALLLATLALSAGVAEAQQTGPCPNPGAAGPALIGPSGTTLDPRPTFSWNAVPGYIFYTVKLLYAAPDGIFVNPPGDLFTVFGTSWTPPFDLPVEQDMRWQVKMACSLPGGGFAYGQYGPELFFKVIEEPPPNEHCNECFGGLNSCLAACPGVCERRVNCGPSGYKCFC